MATKCKECKNARARQLEQERITISYVKHLHKAEAERDTLCARVAELEAKLALAIAVGDETADLRKAAEQKVIDLERELLYRRDDQRMAGLAELSAEISKAAADAYERRAIAAEQRVAELERERDGAHLRLAHYGVADQGQSQRPALLLSERIDLLAARCSAAEQLAKRLEGALRGLEQCICWSDTARQWGLFGNERLLPALTEARAALAAMLDEASTLLEAERARTTELEREIERLRGFTPELPPRSLHGEGDGMPRYGLRFNGPTEPFSVPMADGYWTPWHLAETLRDAAEQQVKLLEGALGEDSAGVPLPELLRDAARILVENQLDGLPIVLRLRFKADDIDAALAAGESQAAAPM